MSEKDKNLPISLQEEDETDKSTTELPETDGSTTGSPEKDKETKFLSDSVLARIYDAQLRKPEGRDTTKETEEKDPMAPYQNHRREYIIPKVDKIIDETGNKKSPIKSFKEILGEEKEE